jgi:beta-phosphoglucomutase-like phosphatase (HAD superfamily)
LIRAVIFDFDGVIANSEPLHLRGFQHVLAELGLTLTEDQYYATYLGYDDAGAFEAMLSDRRVTVSAATIAELVGRKARYLSSLRLDGNLLFPGARAAIERLGAVYPLAIASGALRAEILVVLEAERLMSHFAAIVAAEDAAVGKPAPDPYLRAVERLAAAMDSPLLSSMCVAVEDSRWGLQSARTAGLRTVGVTHTYGPETLVEADAVIAHLDLLTPALLGSL